MQKSLVTLTGLLSLVVLVGAGCTAKNTTTVDTTTQNQPVTETQPTTTDNKPAETNPGVQVDTEVNITASMSAAEVAQHNKKEHCYIIVHNSVYNVTAMIDKHPGGADKIIPLCGKDATVAFTGVHGGMELQESTLASFKIAELEK